MSGTTLSPTGGANDAIWYVAQDGGHADGPLTPSEIGERLRDAKYTLNQMAWRQGMNGWSPISRIPELQMPGTLPPLIAQPAARTREQLSGLAQAVKAFDAAHVSPALLRRTGRIAAALGLLSAAVSVLGWRWGHTWWPEMYLFWVLFALCEGQAGIWSTLAAMTVPPAAPKPDQITE